MQWDHIRMINLSSNLRLLVFMEIINGMDSSNRTKGTLSIAIIIKTKMVMNMLNIAIKEMKRIFSMIFSIKKTKGMNQWNSNKKIIRNIASTIQINKKINKENMKMHGNNICDNSMMNNKDIMKNKKECTNNIMAKIIHSPQTLIIHNLWHVEFSEFLFSLSLSLYFGEYYFQKEFRENENFMNTCSTKKRWKYLQECKHSLKCILAKLLISEILQILILFKILNINNQVNSIHHTQDHHNEIDYLKLL